MNYWFAFLWLFFCFGFFTAAQDKIIELGEVKVQSTRLEQFGTGSKVVKIDSSQLARFKNGSLADLLSQNNLLFIKTYSPGNLSTPTFRGTGPAHTAVLWNGFNIQSPMNGQSDFALMPANFMNNVQVQYGGAGALFGSGVIGGTIHLNNLPNFNRGISGGINASVGSFGNFQQNISAEISKAHWVSSIKLFHTDNKNDYTFKNSAVSNDIQRQVNASVKQSGLLFENYFKINPKQIINLLYWYQTADRQIPPTLLAGNLRKDYQQDETHRLTSQWQKNGEKVSWAIRSAFFTERILFGRPGNDTSQNIAYTFITEAENTMATAKNQSLKLGVNNTFNQASGDNLPTNPVLNRPAVFASYKLTAFQEKWTVSLSVREQLNREVFTPITPSLGIVGMLYKDRLKLTANISRNYRLPTFNDLNWKQGLTQGNPDLQPESGWSQDAGLRYEWRNKQDTPKLDFNLSANVFNSNINNWIYWHDNLDGVLGVDNIQSVWSRGFEVMAKFNFRKDKWHFYTDANFDYTVATVQATDYKDASSLHKQLIYVPYNKAFVNVGMEWNGFTFNYNHAFTGFRYSSEANTSFLPAYQVGNVYASYQRQFWVLQCQVFGRINNVWNENYQVLASRPMPLINYLLGINLTLNIKNQAVPKRSSS